MITFCLLHNLFFFSWSDSCFSVCQLLYGIMTPSTPCPLPLHFHFRHSHASGILSTASSQRRASAFWPTPVWTGLLCAWYADAAPSPLLSVPEVPSTPVQYWTSFFRRLMSPFFFLQRWPVISLWKCKELSLCSGNSILVCLVRRLCSPTVLTIWWAFKV